MIRRLCPVARKGEHALAAAIRHPCHSERRRPPMKWETPSATDFRFGFEITMYVAAR